MSSAGRTVWNAEEIGADQDKVGLSGSATRVVKIFFPQRSRQGEILQGDTESQVESLIGKLKDNGLM